MRDRGSERSSNLIDVGIKPFLKSEMCKLDS